MSNPQTLPSSPSVISSQGSASGPTPCDRPDGPTTAQFGQVPALASLSARLAKVAGLMTSGTYGLHSTGLSHSVDLSQCLANRLQEKLENLGSTLYKLTWRVKATPAGRQFSQLVASVPRTKENDYTGWGTPRVGGNGCPSRKMGLETKGRLEQQAFLAVWPTPNSRQSGEWRDIQKSGTMKRAPCGRRQGARAGPTNGQWRDADWLGCRDGVYRSVEPGTFPLVDGAPARVGRLRGYGNAIVAPQAQAFIEAYCEVAR